LTPYEDLTRIDVPFPRTPASAMNAGKSSPATI